METGFAPCRSRDGKTALVVPVVRRGRNWVTAEGLIATARTVRATEREAWVLARKRYPGLFN